MEILIKREAPTPAWVMGTLWLDGIKYCDTLEDPPREEKIPKITGIPAGRYEVIINFSNRFQKEMPLLLNVPGFSGVRIHGGRNEGDTEGCILVGYRASGGLLMGGLAVSPMIAGKIREALETGKVYLMVE